MSINLSFNDYIGPETIVREYKEFTLVPDIDQKDAEKLIKSSEWMFNYNIKDGLLKYMKNYVPKYISAFMESKSKTNNGELYFGINDFGVVHGIPYQGDLEIDFIHSYLMDVIDKYIITSDKNIIKENIKLELINLNFQKDTILEKNDFLLKYYSQVSAYKEKEDSFQFENKKWIEMNNKYNQKLIELFNGGETRKELYNYILKHKPDSQVLKMLIDGFTIETKVHEEVIELKDIPDSPYYWLCRWKDEMLEQTRLLKPTPSHRHELFGTMTPLNIISKPCIMNSWWLQNNPDMNLYLVKINFTKPKENIDVFYIDPFNKVNRCFRTDNNGDPYCEPL